MKDSKNSEMSVEEQSPTIVISFISMTGTRGFKSCSVVTPQSG